MWEKQIKRLKKLKEKKMINVSDSFIIHMKEVMKLKGIKPSQYVICFVTNKTENTKVYNLTIIFVPLVNFEKNKDIPFDSFLLIKKSGCWFVVDYNFLFHAVSRKITINTTGDIEFVNVPLTGEDSMVFFVGQCLLEHMKEFKLTQKEICLNLGLSLYKFNKIISGKYDLDLKSMCAISRELQGFNNKLVYSVIVEKYNKNKQEEFEL